MSNEAQVLANGRNAESFAGARMAYYAKQSQFPEAKTNSNYLMRKGL